LPDERSALTKLSFRAQTIVRSTNDRRSRGTCFFPPTPLARPGQSFHPASQRTLSHQRPPPFRTPRRSLPPRRNRFHRRVHHPRRYLVHHPDPRRPRHQPPVPPQERPPPRPLRSIQGSLAPPPPQTMTDVGTAALGCPAARMHRAADFAQRQTPVRPLVIPARERSEPDLHEPCGGGRPRPSSPCRLPVIPTRERSEPGGTCFSMPAQSAQDKTSAQAALAASRKGRPKIARQFTSGNAQQIANPVPEGRLKCGRPRHPDEHDPWATKDARLARVLTLAKNARVGYPAAIIAVSVVRHNPANGARPLFCA
jgi:hypothetical protein